MITVTISSTLRPLISAAGEINGRKVEEIVTVIIEAIEAPR